MEYVEYDPQDMLSRVEKRQENEMTVGQIMDQRRLRREHQIIEKEKKVMAKRIDYNKAAKAIVKECDMTVPTTAENLGELFGAEDPSPYVIKRIKDAFLLVGWSMKSSGKGSYQFTAVKPKETAAKKAEAKPKPKLHVESEPKQVPSKEISLDQMTEELIKKHVKKALEEQVPKVVSHPEYDLLKSKIKSPAAMTEMNGMMESLGVGLQFVIKEIELVACPVPKYKLHRDADPVVKHICEEAVVEPEPVEETKEEDQVQDHGNLKLAELKEDKPRVVAITCDHCLNIIYASVRKGEKITCRCGEEMDLEKRTLVHTKYKCDSCGEQAFLATDKDIDLVNCRNCRAPIDLQIDKNGQKRSLTYTN